MSFKAAEVSSLSERINWEKVDGLVPASYKTSNRAKCL